MDKKILAGKIQDIIIGWSIYSVGKSIPFTYYEIPIPEEVFNLIKEKERMHKQKK